MGLQTQYATALLLGMAGAVLGAVYDIYRTSLREWRFLRRFSALFDILFWIFSVIFVFSLLLGVNDGEVRIITFVLLSIGYLIYFYTAHPLVVASTQLVVRFIYKVLQLLAATFVIVCVRPVVWTWQIGRSVARFANRLLLRVEPVLVWPIWQTGRLAKKILRPIVHKEKELRTWVSKIYRTFTKHWFETKPLESPEEEDEPPAEEDSGASDPELPERTSKPTFWGRGNFWTGRWWRSRKKG